MNAPSLAGSAPPKRLSRLGLYLPISLLLLVVVGWCGFWFYAAHRVGEVIDDTIAREAAGGRVWNCPQRYLGGFPFRIELSCAEPTYVGLIGGRPAHGQVKRFSAVAQIYQPNLVLAEIDGPLAVKSDDGAQVVALDWANLTVSIHEQGSRLARFSLVAKNPKLDANVAPVGAVAGSASDLQMHIRPSAADPSDMAAYDIALTLADGHIPMLDALLGTTAPVAVAATARVGGVDLLAQGGGPQALDTWRLSGGHIDLQQITVSKGASQIDASGGLTLDDAHRLAGRIDARVAGLDPILVRFGVPPATAALSGLLGGLLGGGKSGGGAGLPLTIVLKDGRVSAGPIRLPVLLTPLF